MAPEQLRGESHAASTRADVYALGVILRELLDTAEPGTDARLRAIVSTATAEDPADRYESVVALSADVSRYLDGQSVGAYREGPLEKLGMFLHRHRTPIALVGTYLLVRVLVHLFQNT